MEPLLPLGRSTAVAFSYFVYSYMRGRFIRNYLIRNLMPCTNATLYFSKTYSQPKNPNHHTFNDCKTSLNNNSFSQSDIIWIEGKPFPTFTAYTWISILKDNVVQWLTSFSKEPVRKISAACWAIPEQIIWHSYQVNMRLRLAWMSTFDCLLIFFVDGLWMLLSL